MILRGCATTHAKLLAISSLSLINLSIDNNLSLSYIEISAPCLSSLTLAGNPVKILRGSSLAFVKELNFGTNKFPVHRSSSTLLSLLQELPNTESFTITASALRVAQLFQYFYLCLLKMLFASKV